MAVSPKTQGKVLETVGAGNTPFWEFIEKDEHTIILREIDQPDEVRIPKQALEAFAGIFAKLAKQFTV
jgi:hypothetical protein